MGSVICGNDMAIDGVHTLRECWVRYIGNPPQAVASNTQQGTLRREGPSDWRGIYMAYGAEPVVFPGDAFSFVLSTNGDLGYVGTAIVDRLKLTWDQEKGIIIEHEVQFSANGALEAAAAVAADAVHPDPPTSKKAFITLGGTLQTQIRQMEMIITAANKPYVTSTTEGLTLRKKGPIDGELSYKLYAGDPAELPTLGQDYEAVLTYYISTGATKTWQMKWAHINAIEDYGVSYESRENVGGTVRAAFNGFLGTAAGHIINPAGVTKWPAA